MTEMEGGDQGSETFSPVAGRTQAQQHPVIQAPPSPGSGPRRITSICKSTIYNIRHNELEGIY